VKRVLVQEKPFPPAMNTTTNRKLDRLEAWGGLFAEGGGARLSRDRAERPVPKAGGRRLKLL